MNRCQEGQSIQLRGFPFFFFRLVQKRSVYGLLFLILKPFFMRHLIIIFISLLFLLSCSQDGKEHFTTLTSDSSEVVAFTTGEKFALVPEVGFTSIELHNISFFEFCDYWELLFRIKGPASSIPLKVGETNIIDTTIVSEGVLDSFLPKEEHLLFTASNIGEKVVVKKYLLNRTRDWWDWTRFAIRIVIAILIVGILWLFMIPSN